MLDAFHAQSDVSEKRQAAWAAVYRDWQAAGGPFQDQDRLIDWLEAVIRSVDPEHIGAIPEKPTFDNGRPPAEDAG